MNLNTFTIKSQEAIQEASNFATINGNQALENGHILKGIIKVDENVVPFIFKKLGVNIENFQKLLENVIATYPKVSGGNMYLSNAANQSTANATTYLREFNDEFVSIEHLLLGILTTNDAVSNLMKDSGMNEKDMKAAIAELRKGARVTSQSQEDTYNALKKYAINLNEQAKKAKLDPIIGS